MSSVQASHVLHPVEASEDWWAYHSIRRRVLFEARGQFGVYQEHHPDEAKPLNHPMLLLHDHRPIGVIRIDISAPEVWFRRVAIVEGLQRRGHGSALLILAEDFAKTHGCTRALSNVDPDAVPFYQRCGFERQSCENATDSVPMQKQI